jgi:hypothetical protein
VKNHVVASMKSPATKLKAGSPPLAVVTSTGPLAIAKGEAISDFGILHHSNAEQECPMNNRV